MKRGKWSWRKAKIADISRFDSGEDAVWLVSGFTYIINIEMAEEGFLCYTTHRKRYEQERRKLYGDTRLADGNERLIKKPETVIRYIEKWTEK